MEIGIILFIIWILYMWYADARDHKPEHVTQHSYEASDAPYKAKPTTKTWNRPDTIQGIIDYENYIKSARWLEGPPRKLRLLHDKYACVMCGDDYELHIHHIHYDNLGYETQEQLITLCAGCHSHTHTVAGKGAKTYPPIKKLK